ncbi:VanZ family protein [Paenibacillus sp. M1]|uniref:VanZ family protein n=1 Tax=Paenibacillus haidiansis TaxID=1574488 RepID=A0ABU7VNJ8_9BACL
MKRMNRRRLQLFLLILYTCLLAYWMLFGFGRSTYSEYMYNLRPFSTIGQYLQASGPESKAWMINLLGNIGVFIPFGILLPSVFQRKMTKSFIAFLCGLFILESLQLLLRRGSFDIDDFILNSAGFMIGFGLFKIIRKQAAI